MTSNKKISFAAAGNNQLSTRYLPSEKKNILPGQFKLAKDNNLIYLIEDLQGWRRKYNMPDKIEFEGRWRLNSNHDLVLNLDKKKHFAKSQIVLKGDILDCRGNSLIFAIKSGYSDRVTKARLLRFKGKWQVDKTNRIIFEVYRRNIADILTFKGAWQLNKNQEIVYEYQKLKTKNKRKLVFKGFWNISSKNRLSYVLEGKGESRFDFRAFLGTPNVYPAGGKIKYRLGTGLRESAKGKTITLYGVWKFSRKFGLVFEMGCADKKVRKMQFGASVNIDDKNRVIFNLNDRQGKPLGMSVTFKRKHFNNRDFEYFLRLKREETKPRTEIGGTIRF